MNAYRLRIVCTLLGLICCGEVARGQASMSGEFRPVSKPGGYASQELQSIYQQSIGTGYTSAGVTANVMNHVRANAPGYNRAGTSGVGPRLNLGTGGSGASKPFSGFSPSPTVSPYLNLFREDLEGGGDLNYNTLVRPQLQQQAVNQQTQRQGMELQRRLQAISAQSDFNPQGSESQYPTGHQTVFRYYGHYYPTMGIPRR